MAGMTAAARRNPRLIAGVVVAVVMWVLVVAGSDPTIDVKEPFCGQVVTAQDARSYYGLNLDDLYTGRTEWNTIGAYPTRRRSRSSSTRSTSCPGRLRGGVDGDPDRRRVAAHRPRTCSCWAWRSARWRSPGGNISLLLTLAIVWGFRWP